MTSPIRYDSRSAAATKCPRSYASRDFILRLMLALRVGRCLTSMGILIINPSEFKMVAIVLSRLDASRHKG